MSKDTVTSENTKKMLSGVLKELLDEKEFSKITIADVTSRAGVNRKTFYYHFRSVDALLAWTFEKETVEIINQYAMIRDLDAAINFILDYIEDNHQLLRSLSVSIGRSALHKFLYDNIYPLVFKQITAQAADINDPEYIEFITEFYTEASAGMLLNWIEKPILRDRKKLAEYTVRLVKSRDGISDYFD